jgi:hypothetical protein
VGAIVTFDVTAESLALGLPAQEAGKRLRRFVGEVVDNQPMQPFGPGAIPTRAVSIRGKTGKTVTVDGVAVDLKEWSGWTSANAACKDFNQ